MTPPPLPSTCGLWPTTRRLHVAIHNGIGLCPAITSQWSDEALWALVQHLADRGVELVVPMRLFQDDADLAERLRREAFPIWLVPDRIVDDLRTCAFLDARPPRYTAAMLATLPRCAHLRAFARRLPQRQTEQLRLW